MIFEIISTERTEYAQAVDLLHLLKEYSKNDDDEGILNIEKVNELSDEQAKSIMLINPDYNEDDEDDVEQFSVYDCACGVEYRIIGSTEWY